MRRFVFALVTTFTLAAAVAAQTGSWQIDPNHSSAQFSVRHLGVSMVRGAFTKVSGKATYDSDPAKISLDPTITFHSKHVTAAGPGKLQMTGDLTIHGTTKEVVLDVDGPSAPMKDPWGNQRIGASATTKINRKDFGVNGATGVVGDDLQITIDVELIQPQAK